MEGMGFESAKTTDTGAVRSRLDPRTGKQVLILGESFWRDHEARRKAAGTSLVDYCATNQLAVSTFRRWVARFEGRLAPGPRRAPGRDEPKGQSAAFLSMPIRAAAPTVQSSSDPARVSPIEIDAAGVTVRLYDEAARHVIESLLSRLRGSA